MLSSKVRNEKLSNLTMHESFKEQEPCSLKMVMHYSFDYAQQVHYPYSSQQKGKEYFITARKCQIFGVCAEAISRQVLFLNDESEVIGKGSTAVISMLDAFFRLHGLGENEANLHADNCVGQNKNKYVMWYLMWRVMNGLHERIKISFMPSGHTKFSPDSYFGLFKIRYRNSTIDCLEDLITCSQNTCKKGTVVPQVYGQHLGYKEPIYQYRNWGHYLEKYFKPIEGIAKYHYFTFDKDKPGWVKMSETPDGKAVSLFILKKRRFKFQDPLTYPSAIKPDDLSQDRKKYLYKNVRPHVRDPKKKDITCPKP